MNAAVFIDRDNTLIANDGDLGDPAAVRLLRGAASAVASLKGLGYRIVVVTNQGGVARGKYGEEDVRAVHEKINEVIHATTGIRIDRYYYCPFHPEGSVKKYKREHPWRKPQPGMLLEAARELDLDLSRCWMIGDQLRDVQAGQAAGARTILLTGTRSEGGGGEGGGPATGSPPTGSLMASRVGAGDAMGPDFACPTLTEAVRIIAQQRRPEMQAELRIDGDGREERPPRPLVTQEPGHVGETARGTVSGSATGDGGRDIASPKTSAAAAGSFPRQNDTAVSGAATARFAPTQQAVTSAGGSGVVPPVPPAVSLATPPSSTPLTPPPASASAANADMAADVTAGSATSPSAAPSGARMERADRPAAPSSDETLRQILAELRGQRDLRGEFQFPHVAALVLVSLAVVCLVAGLVTAQTHDGHFLRWLGASIVAELTAITLLLLRPS